MFFPSNRLLTDTATRLHHCWNHWQNAVDGVEAQLPVCQGGRQEDRDGVMGGHQAALAVRYGEEC